MASAPFDVHPITVGLLFWGVSAFLNFCLPRMSQAHCVIFCPRPRMVSPRSPGSFPWRTGLDTKIWVLGCPLLLGGHSLQALSQPE